MKTAAPRLQAAVRLPKTRVGIRAEIRLEAEGRSEGRPQVVMRAVLEVNLVAHVHPQTNWAPEALDACSRQDRRSRVTRGYVTDRTREAGCPRQVRNAEIDQPRFEGSKQAEWTPTGADLGAEQCMDRVQRS